MPCKTYRSPVLPSVVKPDVSRYVYRGLGGPLLLLHLCLGSPWNAEFIPGYVSQFWALHVLALEEGGQAVIAGLSEPSFRILPPSTDVPCGLWGLAWENRFQRNQFVFQEFAARVEEGGRERSPFCKGKWESVLTVFLNLLHLVSSCWRETHNESRGFNQ